jgi:alkaline phosphatase
MNMLKHNRILLAFMLLVLAGFFSCQPGSRQPESPQLPKPKNIIYFISDGMGYNHLLATNYYEHGQAGAQAFQQEDWVYLPMATYSAIVRIENGDTIFANGYNPQRAWTDDEYVPTGFTGSAEGASAMSSGIKTYSAAIGIGPRGDTLTHISQAAKALGKSIGVVTSVPFNHATPAGFVAHVDSRHNYRGLAEYMLFNTQLDLIMGAGSPDFDNNGQPMEESNPRYFGTMELWQQLKANDGRTEFEIEGNTFRVTDANGDGQRDPWTLIQSREEFVNLASGATPQRVLGITQSYSTNHYGRDMAENETKPFTQPMNENVPTLAEMTRGALNMLSQNETGFFVMIEGGAIDWAGHDNRLGRMIEEQIDFNQAVQAAIEWVEQYSSWDETLIIVTSDHETGYLTGPDHPDPVKQDVINQGQGNLPLAKWNSDGHTNMLVPFYAKGPGAKVMKSFAGELDPVRGHFIQNTLPAQVIFLMWEKPDIKVHRLQ